MWEQSRVHWMGEATIACFDEFFRLFPSVWFVLGRVLTWYVSWEPGSIYLCNARAWWTDFSRSHDVDVAVGCCSDSKVTLVSIHFKHPIYGCIGLRLCWRVFYTNSVAHWWIWHLEALLFIWFWSVSWYLVIARIVCNVLGCFVFYVHISVCYDRLLKVYSRLPREVFSLSHFFLLASTDGVLRTFRFDQVFVSLYLSLDFKGFASVSRLIIYSILDCCRRYWNFSSYCRNEEGSWYRRICHETSPS